LTRPSDRHLDAAELDALLLGSTDQVIGADWITNSALEEVRRHVESCPECGLRVQTHRSVQNEILRIVAPTKSAPGPDCVAEAEWLELAAGVLPDTRARDLLKHVSQCGHCGPLLKDAVGTLSDETTPDEDRMLANLKTTRPEWQRGMAKTLRGEARETKPRQQSFSLRWIYWPRQVFAIAALVIVMAAIWLGARSLRASSVEELLAQAYTQQRPFEARISGAKYGPVREVRGAGTSNFERPSSLLKAESLIAEALEKHPNDPNWLQASARADLLDGHYDAAIKSLQRALDARPDSPALLSDLGSAYFLRGEASDLKPTDSKQPATVDGASDYGHAVEFLGKALAKSPDDPIALFNHALACQKMFLYNQAIDDWEHYLRLDSNGEWSDEARRRLAAVKQQLEQRQKSLAEPPLTPEAIAHAAQSDVVLSNSIDDRSDEYLKLAITDWLPQAFAEAPSDQANEARVALDVLSRITRERHADFWLEELLRRTEGASFRSAIRTLAVSVRANDHGDYIEGYKSARTAAQWFRRAANNAGELRALAEEIYSEHLLWEGQRCIALLDILEPRLQSSNYTWLRAQMALERSNCANLVGDLGTYQTSIDRGTSEAQTHNYRALYLRGLGFQSLAAAAQGEADRSFTLAGRGLNIFWSGRVDLMKGYNLYTDFDAAADDQHLPNLQVAIWREATALIDRHSNVLLRAMAHRWYGNAAYLANLPTLAASEFSKASALLAASPQTSATMRDRVDAEVWLARIEVRQGDVQQASARLQSIKPMLDEAPSFDPEIGFYSTQADIAMQTNDPAATESALRCAVFLAERSLNSLSSETDRREWADQTRNAYRDLVEWKFRQGDTRTALELWEWYRGAELREGPHRPPPTGDLAISAFPDLHDVPALPSPTVVASQLPLLRNETALVYGTFPDGVALWTYDDRGISARWVAIPLPQLQELALRFQRLCSDPSSDLINLRTTARSLYDMLIAPVKDRLTPGRALVFEPDDVLANIPPEALLDSSGHYLIERFSTVISPGLYQAMHLRPAAEITGASPALIVSVPRVENPDFPPLEDAENEARSVAGTFSAASWLQGESATLSAIRQEIRDTGVFHFAGHAISSSSRNGLVLGEIDPRTKYPRLIDAASFRKQEVNDLQLAVLSACQTGTGDAISGGGAEDLARGFLDAGVPHVIASRWNVDSTQTAELMKEFYARLIAGSTVGDAWHTAQLAMVSHPASSHPYYWAAFALHGTS
jgi:CHAT domain-containing protein/tetratricopeptide (TPR) repeat protein